LNCKKLVLDLRKITLEGFSVKLSAFRIYPCGVPHVSNIPVLSRLGVLSYENSGTVPECSWKSLLLILQH
jgi:hypothetical protein